MELELGLKVTKTRDDITSISELWLAKDRAGPVFLSRETDTMFILTAHLKGYKRNNIYIKISEDGRQISISGEKPIQEMVRIGLVMLKKDVDIRGFKRVFRIPDGVILDRIDAKYNQEESMLKIFMPKLVRGICGVGIEELKEEECDKERLKVNQNEVDQIPKKMGETSQGVSKESEIQETEKNGSVVDQKTEEGKFGRMPAEANWVINGDAMGKDTDESMIEKEDGNGGSAREEVGKEGFEARASELDQKVDEHIPESIQDTSQEVSKDSGIQQMEETRGVVEKMEGGECKKMIAEDNEVIEEGKTGETKPGENEEQKFDTHEQYEESVTKEISKDGFDGLKTLEPDQQVADHIPDDTVETKQDVVKESDVQQKEQIEGDDKQMDGGESEKMLSDIAKVATVDKIKQVKEAVTEDEHPSGKVTGDKYEPLQVEANGGFRKDDFSDVAKKELKQTTTEGIDRGQQYAQEEIGEGRFAADKTASQEFPMQIGESVASRSEGSKDKEKEEIREIKEEEDKRRWDETKVAEKEFIAKEKIQESGQEGKYEIKQMIESLPEVPEIKCPQELDLHIPQREMQPTTDTGTYPTSARTRSEEGEKGLVKDEPGTRGISPSEIQRKETRVQEEIDEGRFAANMTASQEFPMQIGESMADRSEGPKEEKKEETKEIKEQEDRRKHDEIGVAEKESITEGKIQESGKERMYEIKQMTESLQEVPERTSTQELDLGIPQREIPPATDIVTHPEVARMRSKEGEKGLVKDELGTKGISSPEIQRKETSGSGKHSVNQDIPKVKKATEKEEEQCTYSMDNAKTVETIADSKDEQLQVPRLPSAQQSEVKEKGKEVKQEGDGTMKTTGKQQPKQDYVASVGLNIERIEAKGESETTPKGENYQTIQNDEDQKPMEKEEVQEWDSGKVDEIKHVAEIMQTTPRKELSRKPEVVERKGEPQKTPEAFPEETSMVCKEVKPKNEIEEPNFKGLLLPTTEIQSKEREECSHHTEAFERTKPSEVHSLPSTQQSIVEEMGKSETKHEASRESLKETPKVNLQEPHKMTTQEGEEMRTLEPHIVADECIEEKEEFGSQEAARGRNGFQEKVREATKGPEIVMEDRAQQQMQENIDREGFEATEVADEELMKREHGAQTLPDKSEGSKPANMKESKEVSKLSHKTTLTAEDKEPEIKETTPEFEGEKFHETKQVPGKMQETHKREHKKEPVKAPPGSRVEPPETMATRLKQNGEELKEVKPKTEIEKSQTKENAENSCIHFQADNGISDAVTSEIVADHPRAMNVGLKKDEPKGDTDKPLTKELAQPSEEMLSQEAYELGKPSMEQDASKAEVVPHAGEEKELSNFVQGTEASEAVADEVARPSILPSLPSTQILEVQGKEQADECYDGKHGESQESAPVKPDQQVEPRETSQPKFSADQQDIKYDLQIIGKEESCGEQLIQEEAGNEQADKGNEVNSQEDCIVAASDKKKDDKRRSKKLCTPLIIVGSTFLVSVIVFLVHHRRSRKSTK